MSADPRKVERLRETIERLGRERRVALRGVERLEKERDTLRTQLADRDELIDRLRMIGARNVCHVNNGSCPDEVEGHAARDNDCPACQTFMDADVLLGKS